MSRCTGSLGKCLLAGDFSSHPARLPVAADSEAALAEAALSAPLAAPSLCCGAVILVPAMELHGEGSSNFPYIASVMRQLQGGGSGMSCLSFSLVAAEPAGLQPAATTGHPWCGVAQAPSLLRSWWQRARGERSECKTSGKPLCSPHQRGEMVSGASPLYPSTWGTG